MTAAPVPSAGARREQDVWFKFSQVDCEEAPGTTTPSPAATGAYGVGKCTAHGQYWDNYWFTRTPGEDKDGTAFGPEAAATAAGFYANLLAVHRYWNQTKRDEGMMELSLPDSGGTNGTWLHHQATHSIIRTMINRRDTFHPTYGVSPGYGWQGQDGFQDVFTTTATMALEWGSIPYAKGVIDNQFSYAKKKERSGNRKTLPTRTENSARGRGWIATRAPVRGGEQPTSTSDPSVRW